LTRRSFFFCGDGSSEKNYQKTEREFWITLLYFDFIGSHLNKTKKQTKKILIRRVREVRRKRGKKKLNKEDSLFGIIYSMVEGDRGRFRLILAHYDVNDWILFGFILCNVLFLFFLFFFFTTELPFF